MSQDLTVKVMVNDNGRILIPSAFRKALGVQGGDLLTLRLLDGEARLLTRRQSIAAAQQKIKQHVKRGRKLSEELVAERRKAALEE